MFFLQTQWLSIHHIVLISSVLLWYIVAFFITSFASLDYEFYYIWIALMKNPVFWLSLLVVTMLVVLKDVLVTSVLRFYFPSNAQIIQEVQFFLSVAWILCNRILFNRWSGWISKKRQTSTRRS